MTFVDRFLDGLYPGTRRGSFLVRSIGAVALAGAAYYGGQAIPQIEKGVELQKIERGFNDSISNEEMHFSGKQISLFQNYFDSQEGKAYFRADAYIFSSILLSILGIGAFFLGEEIASRERRDLEARRNKGLDTKFLLPSEVQL